VVGRPLCFNIVFDCTVALTTLQKLHSCVSFVGLLVILVELDVFVSSLHVLLRRPFIGLAVEGA
jgi:hypothetical protein